MLLARILEDFEYKPDTYQFKLNPPDTLRVKAKVTCSRTGEPRNQMFNIRCYHIEYLNEAQILDWLLEQIHSIERHETREFFKYQGEAIFDPHNEPYDGKF